MKRLAIAVTCLGASMSLGGCAASGARPGSVARSGDVVWSDGFERGALLGGKWREVEQARTDHMASISGRRAREGTRSVRFEVRDGDVANGADERQQLNGALMPDGTPFEPAEGDDYYVAVSMWFEPGFAGRSEEGAWQVFFALTSFGEAGSGPLKIGHGGARRRLVVEGVDETEPAIGDGFYWMNDAATTTGGWHDFVLHVRFSPDPDVGFIELWHREPTRRRYALQTLTDGSTKRFFPTLLDDSAFLKLGLYRSRSFTSTGIVYVDRLRVTRTFASAALPD